METDYQQLCSDLMQFINSAGQYNHLLDWAEEYGHDRDEFEKEIDSIDG